MFVRGDMIQAVLTCRIFIGISSYPWEFLDFSDLIISLVIVYFIFMFVKVSLKFLWRQCTGLLLFNEVLSFFMLQFILSAIVKKEVLKEFAIDCWLVINLSYILMSWVPLFVWFLPVSVFIISHLIDSYHKGFT